MRHGRAKAARKTLQFFKLSVGIVAPYQVLLDGTFLVAMLSQKVPLRDRLDRTLQHQAYSLIVTRSSLKELDALAKGAGEEQGEIFRQARQWGLDYADLILEEESSAKTTKKSDDDGEENPLGAPGTEILHLVRSKPQYFVCSQDEVLLDVLRQTGTTPVMRLSRGVLLLENPSKAQQTRAKHKENSKWSVSGSSKGEQERKLVQHVKQKDREEKQEERRPGREQRAHKKAKGPNPLSCKKKRSASSSNGDEQKRKRRRKKSSTSG